MNLKLLKIWLRIQCEDREGVIICLMAIACVTIATIYFTIQFYITLPNQACNECGYGQAIDVNPSDHQVQCENEKIIQYNTQRDIKDKWGNYAKETGFWVNCK